MIEFADLNAPKRDDEALQDYQKRTNDYKKKKDIAKLECIKEENVKKSEEKKLNLVDKTPKFSYTYPSIEAVSAYNENTQDFDITVSGVKYKLKMLSADAKTFSTSWQQAEVKGISRTFPASNKTDLINLKVTHPKSKKLYPFGIQIKPENDPNLNKFIQSVKP